MRLRLDGRYHLALAGGGTLEPRAEIRVRHDGGHVEIGYGTDLGGRLAWSDHALRLAAQVAGRGLLTFKSGGFWDVGLSGSLTWHRDPSSDRGPSLTVTQTPGWLGLRRHTRVAGTPTLGGLAATGDEALERRRLDLRPGYDPEHIGHDVTYELEPSFGANACGAMDGHTHGLITLAPVDGESPGTGLRSTRDRRSCRTSSKA